MKSTVLLIFIALICNFHSFAQVPGSGFDLDFTTTTKYVNVPHSTSLNITGSITIEAWIRSSSWATNPWQNTIVSKDDWSTLNNGYVLRCGGSGILSFNIGTTSNWKEVVSASLMSLNKWYHVAGTFDGSSLKIYVNGALVGTTSYIGAINTSSYPINIGKCTYSAVGGDRAFDGKMDEIRIWNTALSQLTLRNWMCRKLNASHPNYSNLKGYWRFDEGTGTITADLSGNNNSGTLMNGATWEISGAALGDTCTYAIASPFTLALKYQNQDSVMINGVTGNPDAIYLYRIDETPNFLTLPAFYQGLDTSHYYGVYIAGGTSPAYNIIYFYGSNPSAAHCGLDILARGNNGSTSWTGMNAILNPTAMTLSGSLTSRAEFLLAYYDVAAAYTNDSTSFCEGDSAVLLADSASYYTYQWLKNGNPIPGANDYYYIGKTAGTYTVIVGTGICADTSQSITLLVDPIPPAPVITEINDTLFSNVPSGNQWYDDNGYLPGVTGTYFVPPVQGHYYVIVTSPAGCKSDTSNIIAFGYGSIKESFDKEWVFMVYPNPGHGIFTLETSYPDPILLDVSDQAGKLLLSITIERKGKYQLDLRHYDAGIYFLKGNNGNYTFIRKILIY